MKTRSTLAVSIALLGSCAVGCGALLSAYRDSMRDHLGTLLSLTSCCFVYPLMWCLIPGVWVRRAEPLSLASSDRARRRPVWSVLSELYLDTELIESDLERIAEVLARSGYSLGQLEEILYRELHPLLFGNLADVTGEWAGWDLDWLAESIVQREPARRCGFAIILGKWLVQGTWRKLRSRLEM